MPREENPFRECLYCRREIEAWRFPTANFCRFDELGEKADCAEKFKLGMSKGQYRAACERNREKPIRGFIEKTPQATRRAQRRADNKTWHKCKLGEFLNKEGKPWCDKMFFDFPNKLYCDPKHQVQYNSIKAQLRRVEDRKKRRLNLNGSCN